MISKKSSKKNFENFSLFFENFIKYFILIEILIETAPFCPDTSNLVNFLEKLFCDKSRHIALDEQIRVCLHLGENLKILTEFKALWTSVHQKKNG